MMSKNCFYFLVYLRLFGYLSKITNWVNFDIMKLCYEILVKGSCSKRTSSM